MQEEDQARHRGWRLVVVAALIVVGGRWSLSVLTGDHQRLAPAICFVGATQAYGLDPEQVANATTIASAAKQAGMADHAVTVALTAALQESRLHNLPYGDRDSLGLFQQRPSQGWGTPAQVMDPRYAAVAFMTALAKVARWEAMPVPEAAQAVQRSGVPEAYGQWEAEARALARVTTGEVQAGFDCRFP